VLFRDFLQADNFCDYCIVYI